MSKSKPTRMGEWRQTIPPIIDSFDETVDVGRIGQFKISMTWDEAADLAENMTKLSKKKSPLTKKMGIEPHPNPFEVRIGNVTYYFNESELKMTIRAINEAVERHKRLTD